MLFYLNYPLIMQYYNNILGKYTNHSGTCHLRGTIAVHTICTCRCLKCPKSEIWLWVGPSISKCFIFCHQRDWQILTDPQKKISLKAVEAEEWLAGAWVVKGFVNRIILNITKSYPHFKTKYVKTGKFVWII